MIKIITGHKLLDVASDVIKSIGDNRLDLSCDNIIVVPDRFSLLAEKMVFESLNIKSTFNIRVMGITAVARNIINQANLNCVFCDAQESKFILFRALQKSKNDFVCFSKNLSQGLCQKIQNALSLIRSSNISSDDLLAVNDVDINTQKKLQDIALIYKNYEQMLNSKLDGNNTLKLFTSLIENSLNLKNTNFYFCGFDAFTKQGYEIIKNISKICKNLTIGTFIPTKNKNYSIFDNELYNNLISIFKDNNLEYTTVKSNSVLSLAQKQIFDNIYGYMLKPENNYGYAKVFEMSSKRDEIELVAKKILELTKLQKCKYKDIFVATNESYFEDIENIFTEYGISFYADKSVNLFSTQVSNFLRYALDMCLQADKESIINFVNNYFVNIDKSTKNDIQNFVIENNIEYSKYEQLNQFNNQELNYIFDFINNILPNSTIKEYVSKIDNLLQVYNIEQKIELLCNQFIADNDIINQKAYIQIYQKLNQLNNKLIESIGDEQISLSDFYELYFNAISDIKISQVPLSVDSVFVGDSSSSFFEKSKYAFFVGANQDVMPSAIKDLGLISDNEIQDLTDIINIAPTVKMINKRNKFKLFDILTNASDNLFVTYRLQDEQGKKLLPSQFVTDILTLNNSKNLFSQDAIYENFADDTITKTMFLNPTSKVMQKNISPYNADYLTLKSALTNLGVDQAVCDSDLDAIQNGGMIKGNYTKISQIESYYSCPFAHFIRYGLKLQEPKTAKIEANEFGNFLHEFAEIFARFYKDKLGKLTKQELSKNTNYCFNKLLSKNEYKKLNDEQNSEVKQILFNEVLRFAEFLNYEQSKTDFKVYKTEHRFGDDNKITLTVDNKDYSLIGVVDRIDKCGEYFRIIDYKTGTAQINNSKISNLYYGTKIQVFVYLKAIAKEFYLKPFGAFYLPVTNAFLEDSDEDYKLHGYFLDDINLIEKADADLNYDNPKSRFFEAEISVSKDNIKKNIKKLVRSKNVTEQELNNMLEYSLKMVQNAIEQILQGNIKLSPFEDACEFCKFKSICKVDTKNIHQRKADKKITPSSFALQGDNNGI